SRSRWDAVRSSSEDSLEALLGLLFGLLALRLEAFTRFLLEPRLLFGSALLGLLSGLVRATVHDVLELLGPLLSEQPLGGRARCHPDQGLRRGADVEPLHRRLPRRTAERQLHRER